ncbi:MAG: hypothetical protein A2Y97_01695 [Nitrospirae bacterium RBG_13_39_12]|nr:MAG: hypothetical protein A2Y97_01695 [Nitrospirae bacterium RBG_13_39_12]
MIIYDNIIKGVMNMKKVVFIFSVLFISIFTLSGVFAQEQSKCRITGTLMIKDSGSMGGGLIHFFNVETGPIPNPAKYWRVPDEIADLNEKGEFTIELPAGKYYMGAIKRISGKKDVGPPVKGDFFFISSDEKGDPKVYQIKPGEEINIGTLSEATPFEGWAMKDGLTAIEGSVLLNEEPVEGALVFGYTSPRMFGKPDFVSDKVAKDGRYILRVPEGGSYYLMARDLYGGGPPGEGSIMGVYGKEKTPTAVRVYTGESAKGININVIKFPGRGPREEGMKRFTPDKP